MPVPNRNCRCNWEKLSVVKQGFTYLESTLHRKPKPCKAYREKPVFIPRNPVLIAGTLFSLL